MPIPFNPRSRLSLARVLAADVPPEVRARGASYFSRGAVTRLQAGQQQVRATVVGGEPYPVALRVSNNGYVGSCECRYFADRFDVCKHIWALVLAADARGLLAPADARAWLDVEEPGGEIDAFDPLPGPAARPGPPAPQPWELFLQGVLQQAIAAETARPAPRYSGGEIVYVIDGPASLKGHGVAVHTLWRQRKKNGEWSKPQPAAIGTPDLSQLDDPLDREILASLLGAPDPFAGAYGPGARSLFRLTGPITDRALALLGTTRRLFLRQASEAPDHLRPVSTDTGPAWTFRPEIAVDDDGAVQLGGMLARGAEHMPIGEPQLLPGSGYLIARGALARFDHGGAFVWLDELRRRGPATLPPDAAPVLVEALARSQVDPATIPAAFRYAIVDVMPRPRVRIERPAAGAPPDAELVAHVEFDYDGVIVPADPPHSAFDRAGRRLVRRHAAAEQAAVKRLQQLGFRRAWAYAGAVGDLLVAAAQFGRAMRVLIGEGWHVEAGGAAYRAAASMQVQVRSGIDWFELRGHVDFGDGRSAPLAGMLAAMTRGDNTVVLDDGTQGMVPEEWLRRYARIAAFGEVEGDHVRYRASQAALLDALLESHPAVDVDETFRRARAELQSFKSVAPIAAPASFKGTLRHYQEDALGWFDFLRRFGLGGCLADDMGLGKTVMVLALLDARREAQGGGLRPSLAVVPRSLIFNWVAEAARFAPGLRVLDYTGVERADADLSAYDLVLTTYGTLRRDIGKLAAREFDYVILDEAQAIKNAATVSAKAVRLLRGRHRLALSGTPVENHVGELWSLFDFLNPGLLGSSAAFSRASAIQARSGDDDLALVARALRPLILRRTKDQVAPELPSRTEQTIYCELDTPQRAFYDELRAQYRASLLARIERDGLSRSKMHVLEALLRLRQAACHAGLVDARRASQPSAKFDVLVPQLLEVIAEGHKALVFSQFTQLLGLLRQRLDAGKVVYEYLDGRTRDRAARVERFASDPACRVFLISLKAGGLGLNLTQAEYVFLLDPWWNPAAEAQAIDRAHRIGQTRHVFAYRLIAKDTVEEKVAELQASKRALADAILTADPALIRTLRKEDLDLLLS